MQSRVYLATLLMMLIGVSCVKSDLAGKYTSERDRSPRDYLELAPDGTFTLQEDGSTLTGTYKESGTHVTLTMGSGRTLTGTIDGGVFTDPTGSHWTRQ